MSTLITNRKSFPDYVFLFLLVLTGCASLPEVKHEVYKAPSKNFFIELPTGEDEKRPYQILGWVRAKSTFNTLEFDRQIGDQSLCRNYYNKASAQLLHEAKKAGADAVIKVRSVVFLLDGKQEEYPTPECSDDGGQGEILLKGVAIKWTPPPKN